MRYKKTYAYLSTSIHQVDQKFPDVWKHYVHYCTNEKRAREGVNNGTGPILTIRDLKGFGDRKDDAWGCWYVTVPDAIFIDDVTAQFFEKDPNKFQTAMQSLVLHELIHWARHKEKEPDEVRATPSRPLKGERLGEPGDEFEAYAYGGDTRNLFWGEGIIKPTKICRTGKCIK